MLSEAINAVTQAEAHARAVLAAAEEQAQRLTDETRAAGELAVENAVKKAEEKLDQLSRRIDERVRAYEEELGAQQEQQSQTMRRRAEYRLERAAAFVAERCKED